VSPPELVNVTVDDVAVQVPRGTGIVETALAAGIEIPVFCYEPRLGAPVGACRMCLCEVEGIPKLQTACTMTAQDGMVVRSALTSDKAAEAQNSTLEFILVNHPLDCPVCDKGGECPLQDLTFRYGPGGTRMFFPKRTFEKPIPISPTIALDRERCILCYRCTRFSEAVAEDLQLVALNRGAQSVIATFEDEPYRAPFSGNVLELCPVGALTSTQYRFEARPWEIQNVPTICGLCPVGCNISATTREGKVKRILARNHPEVDEGWLCDKGRFAYPHLYAPDRLTRALRRGPRGLENLTREEALDEAERLLRDAGTHIVTVLSGTETVEQAYALAKLLRVGLGAHAAVMPQTENARALDGFRMPLSSIRDADLIVLFEHEPVAERAPVVDLWIRAARRKGAEILHELDEEKVRGAERAILVWSGPGGDEVLAGHAQRLGAWGAFCLPRTPNDRGVCEAWSAAADEEEAEAPEPIRLLVVSGDEAFSNPDVRELAEQAEHVLSLTMFDRPARAFADLLLPGTSYLEREGTFVNLEGRLQRLRRAVQPPSLDELGWLSGLGERFGVEISPHAAVVFGELSALVYDDLAFGAIGEQAPLPERSAPPTEAAEPRATRRERRQGLRLATYRPLFSGPAVERVPELQFQRPDRVLELSEADARDRIIAANDEVEVSSNGTSVRLIARISRTLPSGTVRAADEHVAGLAHDVEVAKA
jgi:NADH dehydrogenase/NADH:ubiquinone oxidoreductase subunit G